MPAQYPDAFKKEIVCRFESGESIKDLRKR